ncbi:hypothetical protein JEY40_24845 [Bradyrhizobium japonicum]|uniref:hypothetical protein n=1 Tax=Bradyrhizobium japonicum TaxID=375 RepID=UPI00200D7A0E|nr:hypothetical protein [Bradyrhizobium japonicum]UQD69247.1 hypothetical protein JEY40_24845 [Bradyrhizobium japonicum]WAX24510.1 hypothetical protein [Bradyrhizobium phage ppBjS10J-1]
MTVLLERIEPQPPKGIKYMLGDESWMRPEDRSPLRLHCEEWGNLGPMELNPEIKPNKVGLRVRSTEFTPPPGARGFKLVDDVYYWTDTDVWQQMDEQEPAHSLSDVGGAPK